MVARPGPSAVGAAGHDRQFAVDARAPALLIAEFARRHTGWVTPEVERAAIAGSPLRHLATADEVAEVVVLLASHQARHGTGQVVRMS